MTNNFLGQPFSKANPVIITIGSLDELNAWLGLVRFIIKSPEKYFLELIQRQISLEMGILSGHAPNKSFITVRQLDFLIEKYQQLTPAPSSFQLPGDYEIPTFINLARTICRRAECQAVSLPANPDQIKFLNRLSTLLFQLQIYYRPAKLSDVD